MPSCLFSERNDIFMAQFISVKDSTKERHQINVDAIAQYYRDGSSSVIIKLINGDKIYCEETMNDIGFKIQEARRREVK